MGNTLSCASDNQSLRKLNSSSKFRNRMRSTKMNSKSKEIFKSDNNLQNKTDNSDKKASVIENKFINDEKVRNFF